MTCKYPAAGPLAGIRVVDLTSVISGPGAMGLLADQGADVIKVEPPQGDIMRHRGDDENFTPGFVSVNRGKRSMVLDLKNPGAAPVLWKLIATADVFAQNFRPGVIERLGFDPDTVLARHPELVYLSISGVGRNGPYVKKRVYDPVVQALSGFADIQADPVSKRPKMIRTLIADKTTAVYASQAVLAALLARERSGKGQHVEVAMLDTMVTYIWPEAMAPFSKIGVENMDAASTLHDMIFPTADGYITLGAVSDKEWFALCHAIQCPHLIDDPRFQTAGLRNKNRQERMEEIEAALGPFRTAEIIATLEAADVPCAPVLSRWEMLSDPQVQANDIIHKIDQPGLGPIRQARAAAKFSATPNAPVPPAPGLGEHTVKVLESLGYGMDEIATFINTGVAAQA
ncbi:MAG: CoA transferase [Magnetovibrio sp.]|nr:CoA transferase [Magnetovibrio sp.]